ncbi:MFS transporter [Sphingomonas aracearum]|uniref:MFS transporter n=1 Tax=Sphingomonas aracearum TaxID=2283317 RepID=A0A369W1M6_9SPHN|nr:MFS transporter [Sphingomonas aracearum]RDE07260.1 MFS transporter [Sphingomonas aracearum]
MTLSRPRSAGFVLAFALAYGGGVIGYLPLLTLLLPIKVGTMAGDARLDVLAVTVIAGALAASASNILFGWLSDRSLARGGGRRRWMAGGAVGLLASYGGIALAHGVTAIMVAVIAFQVAVNALLAPLLAIMADEVPDGQKGLVGGLLALANPIAAAFSAVLVGAALPEVAQLAIVPLASLACILPLLYTRAQPLAPAPAALHQPPRGLLLAGLARFLVQVAGNALSIYLVYYFGTLTTDSPAAIAADIGRLLTIAFALPLPIAVLAGRLSDRTGRRKLVLLASAALAAGGLVCMAVAQGCGAGAAGFILYTVGSSVFLALHSAFAMQLLPSAEHRGRDLGLLNLTNTLPGLTGPLLAWALATPRDFAPLLLVLAVLTLAGGVAILPARRPQRFQ